MEIVLCYRCYLCVCVYSYCFLVWIGFVYICSVSDYWCLSVWWIVYYVFSCFELLVWMFYVVAIGVELF